MNYKDTVFLPRTDFPMRAGLPKKEPEILQSWQQVDLYRKLRESRQGAPKFILHDGPPYANGQLHIGHALNKILKDVVNRSQSMLGKDANDVPYRGTLDVFRRLVEGKFPCLERLSWQSLMKNHRM